MITTLTGENIFALQQALDRIINAFLADHSDLALERVDGEEASLDQLRQTLTELPLLTRRKLVIARRPSASKQFLEQFEQLFNEVPETTDVVLIEPKLDKRLSYYKFLKSQTDCQEFPELDQGGLARWLAGLAKEQDGTLSLNDARYLVERVGSNQQLLSNELQKLLLYDSNVTQRTVDLLTDPTPQSTIFQLLEAAFAGQTKRLLQLYAEQRALKVEPPQIIAMLTWQLHVLAIIKTAGDRSAEQVAQAAKLNPFVVRRSQTIARGLSLSELKRLLRDLMQIDVQTKRTSIDADEALQHYLLSLANET